jgi:hypothetical protein
VHERRLHSHRTVHFPRYCDGSRAPSRDMMVCRLCARLHLS